MKPILDALRDIGGSGRAAQVKDQVAQKMGISDSERAQLNKSGKSKIDNLIEWARFYLAKSGFLDPRQRGIWTLTEKGISAHLSSEQVKAVRADVDANLRKKRLQVESVRTVPPTVELEESESPEHLDHREVLLSTIRNLPPTGFEHLCRYLLLKCGFEQVNVSGKTGDGGIDGSGTLRLNKVVSTTVLFQCKRYDGSVGAPVVRDFRGALVGRAEKGMIISTGTFTSAAESEARRDGAVPIELINGERLIELFEELEIGLTNPRKVFDVDDEFFQRFSAAKSEVS